MEPTKLTTTERMRRPSETTRSTQATLASRSHDPRLDSSTLREAIEEMFQGAFERSRSRSGSAEKWKAIPAKEMSGSSLAPAIPSRKEASKANGFRTTTTADSQTGGAFPFGRLVESIPNGARKTRPWNASPTAVVVGIATSRSIREEWLENSPAEGPEDRPGNDGKERSGRLLQPGCP